MKKDRMKIAAMFLLLCFLTACGTEQAAKEDAETNVEQPTSEIRLEGGNHMDSEGGHLSGTVPEELGIQAAFRASGDAGKADLSDMGIFFL